ncbi:chloramphenicol acetyltransferase [Wenxinia marina]|uniref:Chloramphenicol O-acetyltransferase n=1 Tax=Wenxinia marina DSM 24838 TaxID=1123501 RepID=A0A0D0PH64_9RHOB|nr:chloramphenicol acetyltransferase [Wenxinia marina]KIQ70666.1 Chloramphenicol O-acetyltransferase [Wenxinia marina DSM 24838]GGL51417.1 chloramphenicol acetyltransferase [Wenxinia marina]
MTETEIDLATWDRAEHFRLFRSYERPHFSVTSRVEVTRFREARRLRGVSLYRATLFAVGAGIAATPALRTRFRGDRVVRHDRIDLSMSVPRPDGTFGYGYVPFDPDFGTFDAEAASRIAEAEKATALGANDGAARDDVAYASCLPWIDFTSVTNALPGPDDCIPRIAWGRITAGGGRLTMAMALEVHHALVDGRDAGRFFDAVQSALDGIPAPPLAV